MVLKRYIYWNQEDSIAKPAGKERAADDKAADRGKGVPAVLPSTVENCEQFALSEGVDLFKAKCDLTNARYTIKLEKRRFSSLRITT